MGTLSNLGFGIPTYFPYGLVENPVQAKGSTDVIPVGSGEVFITTAGVDAMTLALPKAGVYPAGVAQSLGDPRDDGKEIVIISTTLFAHTITTPTNGINGSLHLVTFGALAAGNYIRLKAFNGTWWQLDSRNATVT